MEREEDAYPSDGELPERARDSLRIDREDDLWFDASWPEAVFNFRNTSIWVRLGRHRGQGRGLEEQAQSQDETKLASNPGSSEACLSDLLLA